MLTISHAILHVFDLESGGFFPSERELDLDEKATKSYVQRHLRRAGASIEAGHGQLNRDGNFQSELSGYLRREVSFIDISTTMAHYLFGELRKSDDEEQYDLLVADFEQTIEVTAPAPEDLDPTAEDEVQRVFDGERDRFFAVMLLPRRRTFMHVTDQTVDGRVNEVIRGDSQLPNPTQKVDTYALINVGSFEVTWRDRSRSVGGHESLIIPDGLLGCEKEASIKEVVESVTQAVSEVAIADGTTPTVALARAKAAVANCVGTHKELVVSAVADEVFEGQVESRKRFNEVAEELHLPDTLPLRPGTANRLTKKHRIKTDTGVEITFPSDYADKGEFLGFVTTKEGKLTIEVRNIGTIESK